MKNKKMILGIIGFAAFIAVVYIAYNGLSKEYNEKLNNGSEAASDNNEASGNLGDKENQREKAVDFTVYDEDMNEVKLSDYIGTPVVLNLWATWCGYCKEEMPAFQAASEKYSEDEVKILMINMTDGKSETKEAAIEYMKKNNYTMKMLLDMDQEVAYGYRVSGIPRTIFIDKEGDINMDKVGIIKAEYLNAKIEELINE